MLFFGTRRNLLDCCVHTGVTDTYTTVMIAVLVEAILVASASDTVVTHVKTTFHKKYRIKDMSLAAEFWKNRISQCLGRSTID